MTLQARRRRLSAAGIALCAALALSGATGVAYALFSNEDAAVNRLSVAYHDTEIQERFEPPARLEPGTEIPKEVTVANTGTDACYVRVLCEFADSDAEAFASLDYNQAAWERHGDFWYYKQVLGGGETTEPLITRIAIADAGEQILEDIEVLVVQESVQAKGPDGSYLPRAEAWETVSVDTEGGE